MKDRTGRELKKGQVVDLLANGIFPAYVMNVEEASTLEIVGGQGQRPGRITVTISTTLRGDLNGEVPVYIVRDAPEPKKEEPKDDSGIAL